jgi:hypothetical protein
MKWALRLVERSFCSEAVNLKKQRRKLHPLGSVLRLFCLAAHIIEKGGLEPTPLRLMLGSKTACRSH